MSMEARRGFTLIEIAIVLVVMGLLISGGLTVGGRYALKSRETETERKLDLIEAAITLYAQRTSAAGSCLPCPADGTIAVGAATEGQSQTSGGVDIPITSPPSCTPNVCLTAQGVVPWRSLGLQPEDAKDAWGNRIRYRITSSAVLTANCAVATNLQSTGGLKRTAPGCYPVGDITVNNPGGTQTMTTQAAYVLVSTGRDGAFAINESGVIAGDPYAQDGTNIGQDENADDDGVFAQGPFEGVNTAARFDDLVRWRSAAMIISDCGPSACGNPN